MSELRLQAEIFKWVWNTYPQLRRCFFHVPNGGKRGKIEAVHMKAIGVVAGIPDLLLIYNSRIFAFEVKSQTGTLSDEQKKVHEAWKKQGVNVVIIRTFEEFKNIIMHILSAQI